MIIYCEFFLYIYFIYNTISPLNENNKLGLHVDKVRRSCSEVNVFIISYHQCIRHNYLFMLLRYCFSVLLSLLINKRLWKKRISSCYFDTLSCPNLCINYSKYYISKYQSIHTMSNTIIEISNIFSVIVTMFVTGYSISLYKTINKL